MQAGSTEDTYAQELPSGIERVLLRPEGVYVWGDPQNIRAASLQFRGVDYGLEPLEADPDKAAQSPPPPPSHLPIELSDIEATQTLSGAPARITALQNKLKDWCIPGTDTLQVSVDEFREPLDITIFSALPVPALQNPARLELLAALHHCDADLSVTVRAGDTAPVQTTFKLDRQYTGGTELSGYQAISIALPERAGPLEVSMTARFHGLRVTGRPKKPFLFFTAPRLHTNTKGPEVAQARDLIKAVDIDKQAFHVPLPLSTQRPNEDIILNTPDSKIRLFRSKATRVSLIEDQGHSLVLSSDQPGRFVVKFGGQDVCTADLDVTPSAVRIPPRFLTGDMVNLQICDQWGLQTFLDTYHLTPHVLTTEEVMRKESCAPYPQALSAASEQRYQSLKAHLSAPQSATLLPQLPAVLTVLEGGPENAKLAPLHFPEVADPDVSIIIPAHNKVETTYTALCALLLAYNRTRFEIIVVDDASSDDTACLEDYVTGITIVRHDSPQRFIRACNSGAAEARGRYIALLNNDTEVTFGWLDALIDAFERFDQVGLVGSKLLYPNGDLQDAGGIVWGTGTPWNYGRGENPWDPRFNYCRQVDYLSGAALMTTQEIWTSLGGLSKYLEPMYYEDTDFAFKVRAAGYTTYYVPASVVYHFEGVTSGTDLSSGFKKQQVLNAPKFKRKWARAFAAHGAEGVDPDLEKDRGILGRVLFIDYATPRADHDAGSYAALQEMQLVQALGYKVSFIALNLAHMGRYTQDLQNMGIEVIHAPFVLSVEEFLEQRGAEFDVFYVTRFHVAQEVFAAIRRYAPAGKILFNNADLHFLRELRMAKSQKDPEMLALANATRDAELKIIEAADVVLSYNSHEHAVIESHTNEDVAIVTAPWVVDVVRDCPPLETRQGLSFLGSYAHHPNREGVLWFAREVAALLPMGQADSHLTIYGSGMTEEIKSLAGRDISTPGYIEHIAGAYHRHKVFVAPLLSGAGIKGKVLSAIAHGIPTVLSPIAAEGTGLRHGHDCMIATTPEAWVQAITTLCTDETLWHEISSNGQAYVAREFSFEVGKLRMESAFDQLGFYR